MITSKQNFLWVEYGFAILIISGIVYSFWHFFTYQYFPQPFFYDVRDTWMDWFNPAYWAHNPGTYDSFLSIYPPLTFVILRLLTDGRCYDTGGGWVRDCDWYGIATLHLMYVIAVVITAKTFLKTDRATALPRSLALSIGLPMMWALDRGNVILITFIFIVLAFGPLIRSTWLRCFMAGCAVNMKVYLVGAILAQLLHRRWVWAERAVLCAVLIYAFSYYALGAGSPTVIFTNITGFSSDLQINNPLDVWMASSLLPLGKLAISDIFPATLIIGSRNVDLIQFLGPLLTLCSQSIVMLGAAACYVRPEVVPRFRMLTLSIGIATFTAEVSGYSEILVLAFCFMETGRGWLRRTAIFTGYVLCVPLDYSIGWAAQSVQESYLWQRPLLVDYYVQIGPFVRPLLMMLIPVTLSIATIIDVARDIWADGWSQRWRLRCDVPFLPGLRRPLPPRA